MDIADFLCARLDEDETAQRDNDTSWHDSSCGSVPTRWRSDLGPCDCGVPQRVLADVAAKRAILERCAWAYQNGGGTAFVLPILRQLATVYREHPGYDPEWAPEP